MTRWLRILLLLDAAGLLLPASQCFPTDDDDDSGLPDDDDDVVVDDDDSAVVEPVQVSGSVVAIHRDTGAVLEGAEYTAMAGVLVVYILADPDVLTETVQKVILNEPGDFTLEVPGDAETVYAVVICDWDWDSIISIRDVRREYAFNPILIQEGEDVEGVDLVIDIPVHTGGSPYGGTWTGISGPVNLVNVVDGPIRITANTGDYWGPIYGSTVALEQAGPYSTVVRDDLPDGITNLLGYLDKDGNGLFEFDDWIGEANANPIILGIGDVEGVQIDIPATDALPIPVPSPYVSVVGSVVYGGFVGGDIHVFATVETLDGQVHDFDMMGAPGDFALRVPANAANILIWAVNDEDGDGDYTYATDPFGMHGPIDLGGESVTDVILTLVPGGASVSVSGTITYDGPVGPADMLCIGLTPDPLSTSPEFSLNVTNPSFPYDYTVNDVEPGTWWVGAFLDVDGDSTSGPAPDEASGIHVDSVILAPLQTVEGIDFELVVPTP